MEKFKQWFCLVDDKLMSSIILCIVYTLIIGITLIISASLTLDVFSLDLGFLIRYLFTVLVLFSLSNILRICYE